MNQLIGWRTWSFSIILPGMAGVLAYLGCLTPEWLGIAGMVTALYAAKKYQEHKEKTNGTG